MKRALAAAILTVTLNITTSRGQGHIVMENYKLVGGVTPVFSGVSYGAFAGVKANEFVGAAIGFKADLLFSLDGGATLQSGGG